MQYGIATSTIGQSNSTDLKLETLGRLAEGFLEVQNNSIALETVQDNLRGEMHSLNSQMFHWGRYTSVTYLADSLFLASEPITISNLYCPQGHTLLHDHSRTNYHCMLSAGIMNYPSITNWLSSQNDTSMLKCNECNESLYRKHKFLNIPEIFIFEFEGMETKCEERLYNAT